jgi:hypothetical protein
MESTLPSELRSATVKAMDKGRPSLCSAGTRRTSAPYFVWPTDATSRKPCQWRSRKRYGNDQIERLPKRFIIGITEYALRRRVPQRDLTVRADCDNRIPATWTNLSKSTGVEHIFFLSAAVTKSNVMLYLEFIACYRRRRFSKTLLLQFQL